MATKALQAIVRFQFHNGNVERFKRLSVQCMEIVRIQDTGTLQYDTDFNDDEPECIVIERFRDSDALIQHGEPRAPYDRRSAHDAQSRPRPSDRHHPVDARPDTLTHR